MWLKVLLLGLGAIIVGLVGVVLISKFRLDRANAKLVDDLLAEANVEVAGRRSELLAGACGSHRLSVGLAQ